MKRIFLTAVLIVTVFFASFAGKPVAEGKTFSTLGDYKIEVADNPFLLDGKELETFVISYTNTDMKVTLAIERTKKCKKYYVLSDNLSVQYICNNRFFGVERLGKELKKDGYSTENESLNLEEYFHQRIITDGNNSDLDNSMLIAAYFPYLIKNTEVLIAKM